MLLFFKESLISKPSTYEQDAHLSVVNLVIKPPLSSSQIRDPLSSILRYRRSQAHHYPTKAPRPSIDAMNSASKQNFQSTSYHTYPDDNEFDELIDNDNVSDALSTTIKTFDSSLLCVKSIIPSVAPQHIHHHLLQHH